ncbi:alpha/beta hydrolase [Paraliomyxa miuraensis]|uniref:alpha/beta hydrolase n=1 Tax=Paraliomyxa miuraensis TaxID=376150 RepID=UPI0022559CE2|nr:alpha/beta hydrolase [Paraliomyxa miuraensis]MCX4245187.1 alpha/beta hydrolase [Paraliomyxa miuraensis]
MPLRLYRRAVIEATRLRRLQRGPLREGWSVEVEALTRVLHHYARRMSWVPLPVQRRLINAAVPKRRPWNVRLLPVNMDGIPGEWLIPDGADPERVLLYFHGGGYAYGSIASHRHYVSRIARAARMRALLVDYRLAPEHPFPAAVEDARVAWRWLLAQGVDPSRVAIAGESAGGGLAMATLLETRDSGEPLPAAAVALSPWVDLTLSGRSIETNDRYDFIPRHILSLYAARYAGDTTRTHPLLSPAHGRLHDLPPLLIVAGEVETLVDDARLLYRRAIEAGVDATLSIYPDMVHAFVIMRIPQAREAIAEIATHVRTHTGGARP